MRTLRFLVPGTGRRFRCGGLAVELQTARLVSALAPTEVVTYRERQSDLPFLDDLLSAEPLGGADADKALWIVSWGFDVPRLLRRLHRRAVAYHAHSSGYGFDLPPGVPVLAVSRNTLGYWGDRSPRAPLLLVPNALEPQWLMRGQRPAPGSARTTAAPRPIDVLVQQRKCSAYVLQRLVPALRARGLRVEVQSGWVDDLVVLFNSAAVVLYDSADYWRGRGVSEGFGLPPIEALACGCVVFSSLNHALADCLDPGVLGHQLGLGTLSADVERIVAAVADPEGWQADPAALQRLLEGLAESSLQQRWQRALGVLNQHWDRLLLADQLPLRAPSPVQVRWAQARQKLAQLLHRRR
ncbi:MAG: glycosyltransferase [Synechococcaceae bacterium WB9_2_112]|nr:glycosyltransferase [Synechococcaceae bacterium WB9_2_112]